MSRVSVVSYYDIMLIVILIIQQDISAQKYVTGLYNQNRSHWIAIVSYSNVLEHIAIASWQAIKFSGSFIIC